MIAPQPEMTHALMEGIVKQEPFENCVDPFPQDAAHEQNITGWSARLEEHLSSLWSPSRSTPPPNALLTQSAEVWAVHTNCVMWEFKNHVWTMHCTEAQQHKTGHQETMVEARIRSLHKKCEETVPSQEWMPFHRNLEEDHLNQHRDGQLMRPEAATWAARTFQMGNH